MPIRILIVEDQPDIATEIAQHLQEAGYEVIGPAATYDAAVSLFLQQKPDLALLDIELSGAKTGIDLAEYINAAGRIPFVFLSNFTESPVRERAEATRPADYLAKPFFIRKLDFTLSRVWEKYQQLAAVEPPPPAEIPAAPQEIYIRHNGGSKYVRITAAELLYAESNHPGAWVYTTHGKYLYSGSLRGFQAKVPFGTLVQISRTIAINTEHIVNFSTQEQVVTLRGLTEIKLSIGDTYLADFRARLPIIG